MGFCEEVEIRLLTVKLLFTVERVSKRSGVEKNWGKGSIV